MDFFNTLLEARSGPLMSVQYRLQFLDGSANVLREWSANARSVAAVVSLVTEIDRPPHAVAMRVLDANGREVHSTTTKIGQPDAASRTGR
jgi:hypothetical protein